MKLKLNFIVLLFAIVFLNIFSKSEMIAQYCSPESSKDNGENEYIYYIDIAGNTTETDSPGKFYNDYRGSYNFEVEQDTYFDLNVYVENLDKNDIVGTWIDWNNDEKFDTDTEFFSMENQGKGQFYANIYVPSDAQTGNMTMRIRLINDWWGAGLDACGSYYDDYIKKHGEAVFGEVEEHYITVVDPKSPAKIIGDPISNTNLCTNVGTNNLYVSTEGTVVGYQWQVFDGSDWADIKGANNSDYNVNLSSDLKVVSNNPLTYSNEFRVLVNSYDGNTETSGSATLTAYAPATVSITNIQPFTACESSNTTIRANIGGSYNSIKWQKLVGSTWTDLSLQQYPTANTANLALNNLTVANNGNYRCVVTNVSSCNGGSTVTSSINLTVVSLFAITTQPNRNYTACVDKDPVSLKVVTSGTVLSYQWKKDGIPLSINPTFNTNELVILKPSLKDIGTYTCDIRYADCLGQFTVTTNNSTLDVFTTFDIVEQPVPQVTCAEQDVALSVVAVGSVYGYQWQKDGKNIPLSENPYANSAILYINKAKHFQSGTYSCLIDAEDCENGRRLNPSNKVLVYVKRGTEIITSNTNIDAQLGGVATLSIDAHVTAIPPQLIAKIQWYRGSTPLVNNNKVAGAKSSILSIKNLDKSDFGADYWVVVEGLCSSDTATGFVINEVQNAIITIDPITNVTVCEATSASIKAEVNTSSPINLSYQWLADGTPLANNAKYSGVNTNTLLVNVVENSDANVEFSVIVSETSNPSNTKTSNIVNLLVKELTTINDMSEENISVETGKELVLFVDATTSQNNTLNYQWYKKDNTGIPQLISGETNNNLTIANVTLNDAGEYELIVTTECDSFTFPFNVSVTSAGMLSVENLKLDLNIAPNPTSEILTIKLENIDYNIVSITNTLGEVVFTSNNQAKFMTINVNELLLPNGMYFINTLGSKNYSGRFVVNK